jgi:hypothetical protein
MEPRTSYKSIKLGPNVKGLAFRSVMRSLEHLRGQETTNAVIDSLPRELREGLRYGTIIASGWYPIDWYRTVLASIVTTTGDGERVVKAIGRESTRLDLTGVYKLVYKLLSPETLLTLTSRMFSNYYDTGKLEAQDARKGHVRMCWSGCKGFDRNMWIELMGSSEMMLKLAGATNIRLHAIAGGGPEDDHFELQGLWT